MSNSWISYVAEEEEINPVELIKQTNDFGTGYQERDFSVDPFGSSSYSSAFDIPLIPRSEWVDRIEKMEETGGLLSQIMNRRKIPILDQGRTNYCWMNGVVDSIHAIRARQGLDFLHFSPASAAAKVKNYANRGGWGSQAIDGINKFGICTTQYWPATAISREFDTDQSRANRALYKIPEFYELPPKNFDAVMTALLHGFSVPAGLLWWGHLVDFVDPIVLGRDSFGVRFRNSWTKNWGKNGYGTLTERKATPDEAVVPRTFTLAETA